MGINFRDVEFTYDKRVGNVLNKINLSIDAKDEMLMILGHTGSGKSTLVQHMNALLSPTKGEVIVFDRHITPKHHEKLKEVRHKVGLVFQFPEYQLFEETVLKDVMFGPKNFGKTLEEAKKAAIAACELVGLNPELLDRSPFSLSGGQMRKVAIAGILAINPDVLILDEPTVGLDPQGKKDLMDLLVQIQKETHKSIIIISHDMNMVARYARRVVVLEHGVIVYDGGVRNLFENVELLRKFNLDLPESARLALALKEKGLIDFNHLPLSLDELITTLKRGGKE